MTGPSFGQEVVSNTLPVLSSIQSGNVNINSNNNVLNINQSSNKAIIDWKTSRKLKKKEWISNYFIQCSAYAIMWEERTGMPIKQLVVCIAGDEGAQVFVEDRDNWTEELINTINEYKRRKFFHG